MSPAITVFAGVAGDPHAPHFVRDHAGPRLGVVGRAEVSQGVAPHGWSAASRTDRARLSVMTQGPDGRRLRVEQEMHRLVAEFSSGQGQALVPVDDVLEELRAEDDSWTLDELLLHARGSGMVRSASGKYWALLLTDEGTAYFRVFPNSTDSLLDPSA